MRVLTRQDKRVQKLGHKWPITIYWDDREKKGRWDISHFQFKFVKKRLKVADYTIKGYEDVIAVERKSGFKEFIGNLTGKKRYKFEQYIKKLSQYPLPILVIEGNFSSLQRVFRELKFSKMNQEGVFHWINKIIINYEIPVICMDCKGRYKDIFLYQLFDQLYMKAKEL